MKHFKRAGVRGLVAGLFVATLFGCGDEREAPHGIEAETQQEATNCRNVDETDPEVARSLQGAELTPLGPITVRHEDGKRISSRRFQVEPSGAAQAVSGESVAPMAAAQLIVECTGSCTGGSTCEPPNGCELFGNECTQLRCRGVDCVGTCSKKTSASPPDAGTSDAGTSDAGTSDAGTPDAGKPDGGGAPK
ncbi:hypothetical protein [Corallococcus sicarius]|uniref:Lipoprotein n=1 Tax=Corallococcus sicarius TaxID=2316726 RepID=A0A3A8NAK1_9BACT|nr:hypothetical protein [Corallococcus sicarius]RKH41417.1 hypothetical protein D7X12_18310 [Corallococcus sicarius]